MTKLAQIWPAKAPKVAQHLPVTGSEYRMRLIELRALLQACESKLYEAIEVCDSFAKPQVADSLRRTQLEFNRTATRLHSEVQR